ncbi:hypothetical protein OG2516_06544 [Oceanicola granulosus HTCC2516]|uniref:Uncharacterized protein n=1 Tax=Oceanicola granulosus (strain ATCC BAA-861 / DSM 15982 / KCTC 12143 / HTCC2516) TaxID=314256 RepID=Q2CBM3_OCEGH|nr:hypothetical protein OG2516_06544 [Oceanicola granulosus HTCC2516]
MCGLLGIVHWTETNAHPDAFTGAGRRTIRAERAHRAALVNAALAPVRMKVADFQATSYIVRAPTGRQEIVDDLASVWGAVDRLRGQAVDPLDEAWIAEMERSA